MNNLRSLINPKTFVITRKQLARYLKIDPKRIWNWEKWQHVLWVHLQGRGGFFISYRQLAQWVAACCHVIRRCRNSFSLQEVWSAFLREENRYREEGIAKIREVHQKKERCFNL
jgi:hypothetical protein